MVEIKSVKGTASRNKHTSGLLSGFEEILLMVACKLLNGKGSGGNI